MNQPGTTRQATETTIAGKHGRRVLEGQVLVMFAAGIFLLVGMIAVAVDTGFLMAERRQVQNGADAAALAAAKAKLDYRFYPAAGDLETVQVDAAESYALRNAGVAAEDVDVDTSPDGLGEDYVEVTISKDVDMFFLRALYDGAWGTSATAIAGTEDMLMPYALMSLKECDAPGTSGINASGGITIGIEHGSIMSNCNITRSGDSSIVTADGVIDAAGTIDPGTQWDAGQGFRRGREPVSDPIAQGGYVPPDRQEAKDVNDVTEIEDLVDAVTNLSNVSENGARCASDDTCVMEPGFYGGDLELDVRGTLQLAPGIYYFGDDFFLTQQTNDSLVTGDDVMIYIGDNARWRPHNGQVDIEAPEVSPYDDGLDGMAIWIDNGSTYNMQANNSGSFSGVFYAPDSEVTLQGGPGSAGVQVIVGTLNLAGNGTFDINYENYVEFEVPAVYLVR